jgi:low temperature requirement protein LtrA
MMFAARTNLLRDRASRAPVTQIELFFDLVFAFAITQLSGTLRAHLTPVGVLHTLILFAAVWWVWVYTSWATNWLHPDVIPVRLMLIVLTLAGLALSTSLPDAFGARGEMFALAYVAMQVGRDVFVAWALRRFDRANFRNMSRITCWQSAAGLLWLAGGLLPPAHRIALWALALAVDFAGPSCGYVVPGLGRSTTADWKIDTYHMAERCAGFMFIALGESITVTGATFYALRWTAANAAAFVAAFIGIVALWWIYFDKAAERTAAAFARADDPGRIARAGYTYLHAVLVAGIIVVAAADSLVLEHPHAGFSLEAACVTLGGPALYLAGNGVFRRMLAKRFAPSHLMGLLGFAVLALAAPFLPLLALAGLASAALVAVTILAEVLMRRQEAAK